MRKKKVGLSTSFRRAVFSWLRSRGEPISHIGIGNKDLIAMVTARIDLKPAATKRERMEQIRAALAPGAELRAALIPSNVVIPFSVKAPSQAKITAFYESWEWKRTRYDFLKGKDRRCECCGTSPAHGARMVVDHVKPIRHFWALRLDPKNLQLLCDDCNMGKGSRDMTDWREGAAS